MRKQITVIESDGEVITTTVSDDDTARSFEDLPFENGRIVQVIVTDTDA